MQRKLKNIIMIILIVVLSGALYFTMQQVQNSNSITNEIPQNTGNMSMEIPTIDNGQRGERPEMPNGQNNQMQPPNGMEEMSENMQTGMQRPEDRQGARNTQISIKHYGLIGLESLGIAMIVTYLLMSQFNKKGLKEAFINGDKVTIFILATIIVTFVIAMPCVYSISTNNAMNGIMPQEESTEKDTKAEDVESGKDVNDKEIDLSDHTSNITITEAGEYTLTGEFNHSVLVNADGDVKLNLDGITIANETTATIANISQNGLTLNVLASTTNTLSDGGSSEYDGCVFSSGPLTIEGSGKLNIYGKQEEGEGIATETNNITINGGNINIECNDDGINAGGDGGTITINDGNIYIKASGDGIDSNKDVIINGGTVYSMGSALGGDAGMDADAGITINGGDVIALGSDMLERPLSTSKQYSICFNLNTSVQSGTTVTLKNASDETVATFEANENFRTLIFSNDILDKGTYYLYVNGDVVGESEI